MSLVDSTPSSQPIFAFAAMKGLDLRDLGRHPVSERNMSTILIVDDSPTIRRMVKGSLARLTGVTFAEAASGLEAIEACAVNRVQAVLLDLNMPDMHGLDVLRFLRSHHQYKGVPVLVLTTRGDEATRQAALQAGASAYMTKPFSPSSLASSVAALLSSASARPGAIPTTEQV
jgi:two-component system chemotaxis response regulator CheY